MKIFLLFFLSFLYSTIVEMSQTPPIEIKTIDRTCLIMSITIGMLVTGIVLSTTLTLYITKQCT